jgi:hypothetical protein
LEDIYGLKIGEIDGEICLRLDKFDYSTYSSMFDIFHAWQEQAAKLEQGKITKEEYDQWRYKSPELDPSKHWAKVAHRRSVVCLWRNFRKSRKKKRKHQKRKSRTKHISPNGSMTDIRQMDFCASTSPSGSLPTQKDLADIQFPYLNPHYRAVVAAFVKWKCKHSLFPHCSRKSARFSYAIDVII